MEYKAYHVKRPACWKAFLALALAVLAPGVVPVQAQGQGPRVTVNETAGTITLSFETRAGDVAGSNDRVTLAPVLEGDAGRLLFPPVVIEGRRARVSRERRERSGLAEPVVGALHVAPLARVRYEATVPVGELSGKARLSTLSLVERCGCEVAVPAVTLISGEVTVERLLAATEAPVEVPVAAPVAVPVVVAERPAVAALVAPYTFVAPVTPLARELLSGVATRHDIERYIDENRDNSLTVFFRVNSSRIDPWLDDNARVLEELVQALRSLESAPGQPRVGVLVGGFASPEGNALLNERLALARATAVSDYITSRTSLSRDDVRVHGGGADWRGLRELVAASSMPGRTDVLRVIDTYPVWDPATRVGRLTTLANLRGGEPYRYMTRHFFPRLRNAAFIRVFYEP